MIPGSNRPPYRAPCSGTVLCGNGPRYQHGRTNEDNIPVWLYNATVPNWDKCPGQPSTIPPYERPNSVYITPDKDQCGDPEGPIYTEPSGSWLGICTNGDDTYEACSGSSTPAAGAPDELFDLTNTPPVSWYQPQMLTAVTISNGGSGYEVGDTLDMNGGTVSTYVSPPGGIISNNAYLSVTAVDESGAITALTIPCSGSYQTPPSSPNAVTGGHGTGASIGLTFANQTESLKQCKKIGFKNVQAMRSWHGMPGWLWSGAAGSYNCPSDEDGDMCAYSFFHAYSNSAPQTKYCDLSFSVSYSDYFEPSGTLVCEDSFSIDVSVDPHSGVCTVNSLSPGTGNALNYGVPFGGSGDTTNAYSFLATDAAGMVQGMVATMVAQQTPGTGDNPEVSCSSDGATWSWSFGEGDYGVNYYMSWTLSSSGVSFSGYYVDIHGDGQSWSGSISDNSFSFTYSANASSTDPSFQEINYTITASLGNANTSSTMLSDINTLLDEWDLTDDNIYPWRDDGNTSMAPLVTRNEVGSNVNPLEFNAMVQTTTEIPDCAGNSPGDSGYTTTYQLVAAMDPNSYLYDGSILGAPKPAGYQGFFDFRWEDWQEVGIIDGLPDFEIYGWGGSVIDANADYGIPLNATQWTNVQRRIQFPGGGWIFYNLNPSVAANGDCFNPGSGCPTPGGQVVAQKWAETKVLLPSQNFFRPAGNDRFVYDEEHVYTILSTSGGPGSGTEIGLGITIDCSNATGVVAEGLWGPYQNTDSNWYFWTVTGGGSSVTLNEPVYLLPDNWASASGDGKASDPSTLYCFGKLRWSTGNPLTDPFPILGRAGVTAMAEYESNPDVTQITTGSLPNLGMVLSTIGYDEIDIYDKGMNVLASAAQVTRLDDTDFTVPVALTTIQNAAWIMSHGAPAYQWDDEYPKGDFAYTTWTYWPRQVYEPGRINSVFEDCNGQPCGDDNTSGCECSGITCEISAANVFSAFTQSSSCVPTNPCNPAVLCISPNGESFANGVTEGFASINLDELYGSGWQAEFQQSMTDLFWQTPHVPATPPTACTAATTAWTEDNGSCEANTDLVTFYAHRPLVEARTSIPSVAPSLPSGITIGWESPVTDPDSPDALYPAPSNGTGLQGNVPWTTLDNMCSCIQGSGSFASVYENYVVTCD